MQEGDEKALEGDTHIDKKIVKLGELNKLAYKDLILLINTDLSLGKIVF